MSNDFKPFSGTGRRLGGSEDGYRNLTPGQAAGRAAESRALYQPENIFGITGAVGHNPTTYYKRGDTYGHITTAHSFSDNVGREIPRTDPTYTALNTGPGGRLEERTATRGMFHPSRNPLNTSVASKSDPTVRNTHQAFPGLKGVSDPVKHAAVMATIEAGKPAY